MAGAGRNPVHLATERLFAARIGRNVYELSAGRPQLDAVLERACEILVDEHQVRPALFVRELAYEEARLDGRLDVPLRHRDRSNQTALVERPALRRYVRMVIDPRALQPLEGRSQRVDLVVDAAQHVPGSRLVAELIDRTEPV